MQAAIMSKVSPCDAGICSNARHPHDEGGGQEEGQASDEMRPPGSWSFPLYYCPHHHIPRQCLCPCHHHCHSQHHDGQAFPQSRKHQMELNEYFDGNDSLPSIDEWWEQYERRRSQKEQGRLLRQQQQQAEEEEGGGDGGEGQSEKRDSSSSGLTAGSSGAVRTSFKRLRFETLPLPCSTRGGSYTLVTQEHPSPSNSLPSSLMLQLVGEKDSVKAGNVIIDTDDEDL